MGSLYANRNRGKIRELCSTESSVAHNRCEIPQQLLSSKHIFQLFLQGQQNFNTSFSWQPKRDSKPVTNLLMDFWTTATSSEAASKVGTSLPDDERCCSLSLSLSACQQHHCSNLTCVGGDLQRRCIPRGLQLSGQPWLSLTHFFHMQNAYSTCWIPPLSSPPL